LIDLKVKKITSRTQHKTSASWQVQQIPGLIIRSLAFVNCQGKPARPRWCFEAWHGSGSLDHMEAARLLGIETLLRQSFATRRQAMQELWVVKNRSLLMDASAKHTK